MERLAAATGRPLEYAPGQASASPDPPALNNGSHAREDTARNAYPRGKEIGPGLAAGPDAFAPPRAGRLVLRYSALAGMGMPVIVNIIVRPGW